MLLAWPSCGEVEIKRAFHISQELGERQTKGVKAFRVYLQITCGKLKTHLGVVEKSKGKLPCVNYI
jgi:hypothetical protein